MESSKRTLGLSKGRYVDRRSQSDLLRCADPESLMGDEDWAETGLRYSRSVKATRANEGERTQPRSMGKRARWKGET